MDEFAKIEASVASHKGNVLQGNRDKFYLNGQYMDLHQKKDSTVKFTRHSFQQSVYAIARGSIEGELGEKAAFYAIDALSRYHLDIEENPELSLDEKMKLLEKHLEKGLEKFNKMDADFITPEGNEEVPLGAKMIGIIIDRDILIGFSLGYRGLFIQRNDEIHEVSFRDSKGFYCREYPVKEVLSFSEAFQLKENDLYFLSTDQVYQPTQEEIFKSIFKEYPLKDAVKEGLREALLYEGHDNLTLLGVKVVEIVNAAKDVISDKQIAAYPAKENDEEIDEEIDSNQNSENGEIDHLEKEDFLQKERRSEAKVFQDDPIVPSPLRNGHEKTAADLNDLLSDEEEIERTEEELEREKILEERFNESQALFSKFQESNRKEHTAKASAPVKKKGKFFKKTGIAQMNRNKLIAVAILFLSLILIIAAMTTFRGLRERLTGREQETAINGSVIDDNGQDEERIIDEENDEIESDDEEQDQEDTEEDTEAITDEDPEEEETSEEPSADSEQVHVVVEGDTLYAIAMRYYNDSSMVEKIREYNEKGEDEPIYIGEELLLPEE